MMAPDMVGEILGRDTREAAVLTARADHVASLRRDPARSRAGQVPVWIPLALLCASAAWLFRTLADDARLSGFTSIDPRRSRIEGSSGFVDARWRPWLSTRLARMP